jgi:hypothetical protein
MTSDLNKNNGDIEEPDLFPKHSLQWNVSVQLADMPEELDDPSLSKYIIAFFRDENEMHWCGSGVIVGNLLITAAHVMLEKKSKKHLPFLYFKFENCIRRIEEKDIIYDGRVKLDDENEDEHNPHDLIVFKLSDISSPFVLNASDFDLPLPVYARTYMEDKKSTSGTTHKIVLKKGFRNDQNHLLNKESFEWYNCLLTNGNFAPGNSGTPIYRENKVYGILIGETIHPDYRFRIFNFLDARYIHKTISKWFSHN